MIKRIVECDDIPSKIQRKIYNLEKDIEELRTFECGLTKSQRKAEIKRSLKEIERLTEPYTHTI